MTTVAIDIGHGSDTFPPSKGVHRHGKGFPEHTFNSKVGIELDKLLKANGFDTLMYQKPNAPDVPLWKRTNYYNAQKVDLVWSIHANFNSNKEVEGRCAFYWYTSDESKQLAELYAEECNKAGFETHGNGLHASKYDSWTNLAICRMTNMTAVLTENGFMSNDEEGIDDDFELLFGSKQNEYVKDIARVHAKAIARFFNAEFEDKKVKPAPNHKVKPEKVHWYLKKGDDGNRVEDLQEKLIKLGYDLGKYGADGSYGPATEKAVKAFQRHENIAVDGIYGVESQKAMKSAKPINDIDLPTATYYYRSSMGLPKFHGSGVLKVQEALSSVYFYPNKGAKNNGCDSWYGSDTADAVSRFQSVHGLKVDGDYGPATRAKLIEALKSA